MNKLLKMTAFILAAATVPLFSQESANPLLQTIVHVKRWAPEQRQFLTEKIAFYENTNNHVPDYYSFKLKLRLLSSLEMLFDSETAYQKHMASVNVHIKNKIELFFVPLHEAIQKYDAMQSQGNIIAVTTEDSYGYGRCIHLGYEKNLLKDRILEIIKAMWHFAGLYIIRDV